MVMTTQATIDTKAAQSQELMQMIMNLSAEEIANLQRLLHKAVMLKRDEDEENKSSQRPRRFIDPDDGGPVWELGFIDEFDRASCYEDTRYEL
jgi:hypothetical protein